MQVYLTAAPEDVREAARHNRPLCHAAYRIGTDSALLRGNLLLEARGGLMALSDRDVPPVERPEALCGESARLAAGYLKAAAAYWEGRSTKEALAAAVGDRSYSAGLLSEPAPAGV